MEKTRLSILSRGDFLSTVTHYTSIPFLVWGSDWGDTSFIPWNTTTKMVASLSSCVYNWFANILYSCISRSLSQNFLLNAWPSYHLMVLTLEVEFNSNWLVQSWGVLYTCAFVVKGANNDAMWIRILRNLMQGLPCCHWIVIEQVVE